METFKLSSGNEIYVNKSDINCLHYSRHNLYLHTCKNAFSLNNPLDTFLTINDKLGFFKIENYIINLSQIGCIETKEGYYLVYFKNGNVISIDSGDVLTKWLEMKGSEK
jgi:hypothetical protein